MSIESIPLFPESQVPIILELISESCSRLKKDSPLEREDILSDKLFRILKRSKKLRTMPLVPMREHPLYLEEDKGAGHSGRIDINFLCPPGDETYFAIEAKRLYVNFPSGKKSLIGEYVTGEQGMMCFINGKYSSKQKAAAMLGYVFDEKLEAAITSLSESIFKSSKTLKLIEPHELRRSGILTDEEIYETKHELSDRDFVLYHLLVNV